MSNEKIYLIPGYIRWDYDNNEYTYYQNLTDEEMEKVLNELSADLILVEDGDLSPYSDSWDSYNMYHFISSIVVKHARNKNVHAVAESRSLQEMVDLGYKIAILDEYRKTTEEARKIDADSIIIIDQYLKNNTGE